MKRLSGSKLIEMEQFRSAKEQFTVADTVNLAFAEALIGNFDWCLKFMPNDRYRCDARKPLWNLLAVSRTDGTVVPVMYDFDISGMVTGRHPWFPAIFNAAFVEPRSEPDVEVDAQLQRTRSLFSRADLDAARRRFAAKKEAAYKALDDAAVDERGKRQIASYLDPFFAAMERDDAFYLPVVVRANTRAFTDAAAAQPRVHGGWIATGGNACEREAPRTPRLDAPGRRPRRAVALHWPREVFDDSEVARVGRQQFDQRGLSAGLYRRPADAMIVRGRKPTATPLPTFVRGGRRLSHCDVLFWIRRAQRREGVIERGWGPASTKQ